MARTTGLAHPPRNTAPRLALIILALAGGMAHADGDGERGALVRLVQEIDALAPLVAEAERQADRNGRTRFAYDWLRQDLEKMKQGIRDHLERPRTEPDAPAPLSGDYRE